VINTELILADLDSVQKRIERVQKKAKSGDKEAQAEAALLQRLEPHLNAGKPANLLACTDDERAQIRLFQLLSAKPTIFAANVAEGDVAKPEANPHVARVRQYAREHLDCGVAVICSRLEADLVDLSPEEAAEFLKDAGTTDSGVSNLIREAYRTLGLCSYFTAGEKEVRAWTIRVGTKAPQAAGVIHTDFEKGFIKAEVVSYTDLSTLGSVAAARSAGKYRLEGKEYVFQDGDVALFRFNN
jgi:hypothetical protein